MQERWLALSRPLPAKNCAPPLENWMIAGEFSSLAVSMTAFTVLVLMTLTAGSAKCLALARSKIACNSSPVATPGLICVALMIAFSRFG
jgi:hypothetical protein